MKTQEYLPVWRYKYAEDKPIAFAQCQLRHDYVEGTESSPVGYLEGIFVSEGYRKKGCAAELLSECERWAKEKGCRPVEKTGAVLSRNKKAGMDMKPILFINSCVRKESRTRRLADSVLKKLDKPFEEVCVNEICFPKVDEAFLTMRDRLVSEGDLAGPLFDQARRFAEAETIVIDAPYWDLSFPAALKQYFEQINVPGVTFRYSEDGIPEGLCRAKRLIVVTTAGGTYVPEEYGYGYIKALAQGYYGIPDVISVKAAGLDIEGADVETILRSAQAAVSEMELDG